MKMVRLMAALLAISMTGCASQQKLMTSLAENDIETAKEMVEAGINPYLADENGESAVSRGLQAREGSDIHEWAAQLAATSAEPAKTLWNQAKSGSLSVDQFSAELARAKFYIDARVNQSQGWTMLMSAVYGGRTELARALIEAGTKLETKDDLGWTALHHTANNSEYGNRENDVELARLLTSAGASLNAQTKAESSPLYLAVLNERPDVLDVLIKAGADLNLPMDDGWTPLMKAVFDGNVEVARSLIKAGANLEAKSNAGWTALHFTANKSGNRENAVEQASLLLEAGANVNSLNDELVTPLMLTALNDRRDVAKVLLDSGAKTNVENKFGRTALDEAKREDNYRIAAMIREYSMASSASASSSKTNSPWPAKPAPRQGYTTCNTRCLNGDCYRTYSDGRKVRFQAERKYNPLNSQWEFDSGSC